MINSQILEHKMKKLKIIIVLLLRQQYLKSKYGRGVEIDVSIKRSNEDVLREIQSSMKNLQLMEKNEV